jgi:hypothetical protein
MMTKIRAKAAERPPQPFKIQVVQHPGYMTTYYVPRSDKFPDAAAAQAEAIRRVKRDLPLAVAAGSLALTFAPDVVGGRIRFTTKWWKVDVVIRARYENTIDVQETTEKRAIARARTMMPDRPSQIGVWALFSRKKPLTEVQALAA